jgi:hypothetical protein
LTPVRARSGTSIPFGYGLDGHGFDVRSRNAAPVATGAAEKRNICADVSDAHLDITMDMAVAPKDVFKHEIAAVWRIGERATEIAITPCIVTAKVAVVNMRRIITMMA